MSLSPALAVLLAALPVAAPAPAPPPPPPPEPVVPAGGEYACNAPTTDATGLLRIRVASVFQAKPTEIRILIPNRVVDPLAPGILFVLPVEPEGSSRYGDGLEEIRKLGLHEKLGFIAVAPGFSGLPWYADHPTDPKRRDESHVLRVVLPVVNKVCPSLPSRRRLLGFSKSGWGAYTLILRHPDLFSAAAAWDAPLMMEKPDRFETPQAFVTQQHFEGYRVSRLLREKAEAFRGAKRLVLTGYGNFREHAVGAHALLEELRIPSVWHEGPWRRHAWDTGWLEEAVTEVMALRS